MVLKGAGVLPRPLPACCGQFECADVTPEGRRRVLRGLVVVGWLLEGIVRLNQISYAREKSASVPVLNGSKYEAADVVQRPQLREPVLLDSGVTTHAESYASVSVRQGGILVGPIIYVVDDQNTVAETLTAVLIRAGFSATAFNDPNAALVAISAVRPDIVLSDVIMPGMTGIELAIRVRQMHPECKVLLLSGHFETDDLLEKASREGHSFDILPKPFHPDELLAKLQALV